MSIQLPTVFKGKFKILSFCHVCFCGVVFCFCLFVPFIIRVCFLGLTFQASLHEEGNDDVEASFIGQRLACFWLGIFLHSVMFRCFDAWTILPHLLLTTWQQGVKVKLFCGLVAWMYQSWSSEQRPNLYDENPASNSPHGAHGYQIA